MPPSSATISELIINPRKGETQDLQRNHIVLRRLVIEHGYGLLRNRSDADAAVERLAEAGIARDDGVTLASYTASTKPKWAAEAQAFVAWRDNVWFYAYGELAKVQAGQRQQPTVEQFLTEIAPIAWPAT